MAFCRKIPDLADGYIDRDGSLADRLRVGIHLRLCGHCRAYVDGIEVTRRLAAASLAAEPTDPLVERLLARLGPGGDRLRSSPDET